MHLMLAIHFLCIKSDTTLKIDFDLIDSFGIKLSEEEVPNKIADASVEHCLRVAGSNCCIQGKVKSVIATVYSIDVQFGSVNV